MDKQSQRGWRLPGAAALRHRDYRLFWSGYVTEVAGQQMLWVAQGWLIYELSGSAVLLGAAGLARAIPGTILSFVGGALADKLDQRRLLIAVQVMQMALLAGLGTLTITGGVEVWHLLVIVSASAAAQSFENPARQAIFPKLVPRADLMDAVALNATIHPGTRFAGPFLGGLLMAQVRLISGEPLLGAATLFYLTAFGYVLNACLLYFIQLAAVAAERKKTSMFADMGEGVKFITRNPIFLGLILVTYCTQFFGWSFQSLFPVFVKDIFQGGEFELGLMGSALGAGSLLGATTASNLSSVRRRGLLVIGGFMTPAALIILFSAAPYFTLALGLLFFIGCTQAIFNVTAQSTLQYLVPNDYRGRVMGIWGMTHTAVQPMGQLQMGVLAGLLSAPIAVAFGGVAMLAFAVLVVIPNRRIRRLTLEMDQHGEEEIKTQLRELAGPRH
ncbi:MAG: MFS transporter [Dehalococcoidia bacterium]|nr:MFS transporter [Dehalococcoidia bacterium]